MPQVRANHLDLEYETFGRPADPALLLIMGLGAQLVLWPDDLCAQLAAGGFHVIRFDNRDVGLSQKFETHRKPRIIRTAIASMIGFKVKVPYTLDDMARDAVGLLDALKIRQAHIVGASMGGMIAQIVAAKFPERVLSVGLIMTTSGNPRLPRPSLEIQLRLIKKPAGSDRETMVRHMMTTWRMIGSPAFPLTDALLRSKVERSYDRSSDRRGLGRQLQAILASGSRVPLLKRIHAPTLIIHGKQDPLVPVAAAHELGKHIPGARVEIIDGMGHDLPPELLPKIGKLLLLHAQNTPARAA